MIDTVLKKEAYDAYRFLIDHTNFDESSLGYGLTLDCSSNKQKSSIAGSGFMLSSLVIGVQRKWDDLHTNLKRAQLTLKNFYFNIPHYEGMFAHYVEFDTGKRYQKCEYSTIDTVLFVNGMLAVDHFFQDEVIQKYSKAIFERINWQKFIFKYRGRYVFRMAYNDIHGGDYLNDNNLGWIHHWSMFAEQLSMYFLAAGSTKINSKMAKSLFLGFDRTVGGYQDYQFVYTPMGPLFTHLYSHAWFDFGNYYDLAGFDWYKNTEQAIYGNYQYCQDEKENYRTFAEGLWGLSPCNGINGYSGYGAPPYFSYDNINRVVKKNTDGTVALYAIFGSLPYCPELVKKTIAKINLNYPELSGPYGFYDSINLENGLWIGKDYLSIDKGITLLMIDNYYYQTTWNYYTQHPLIQKAIKKLEFQKKGACCGNY